MKKSLWTIAALGILVAAGLTSCARVGEMEETSKSIPLDDAQSLQVDVRMNAGELRLEGGAPGILEARFRTNVEVWKPEVTYRLEGTRGVLLIEQPRRQGISWGRAENKWDVRLNDRVPVDLTAKFGAGEARVNLSALTLDGLSLKMGVGDLTLDLGSYAQKGFSGHLKGGVGHATIYLPEGMGVRVSVHGGLGSIDAVGFQVDHRVYTNEAYAKGGPSIDLDVEAGIGSLDLRLR
jgi:hypothetical protein